MVSQEMEHSRKGLQGKHGDMSAKERSCAAVVCGYVGGRRLWVGLGLLKMIFIIEKI